MQRDDHNPESKPTLTLIINADYPPPADNELITRIPTQEELVANGFKRHLQIVRDQNSPQI